MISIIQNSFFRVPFFELKGVLSSIFEKLGMTDISYHSVESSLFSEGLMGKIKAKTIVEFGRVNPHILQSFDIEQEVLYADVHWDAVLEVIQNHQFTTIFVISLLFFIKKASITCHPTFVSL
jgi:phenylalanyl-tRNA synthetase beta subunit